jgi:hypothetical protein
MRFVLTLALLALAGCTCNDPQQGGAGMSKAAKMKAAKFKAAKMKMKAKGPIETIPASIWLVDTKKLDAGEADPWVKVERQIGAKTPAKNTVWQLFKGPTAEETAQGLTLFRSGTEGFQDFTIEGTTATLQLRGGCDTAGSTYTIYDHLSKTLKAFPEIQHVRVLGPDGSTQAAEGDSKPACLEP